jgi:hypothetical protein
VTTLGLSSTVFGALCAGSIAGLLAGQFGWEFGLLLGVGVSAGLAAILILGRAAFAPDEDTEPEIRPPTYRTHSIPLTSLSPDGDDV